jgi:pimeloyl-ACP methyl ester carboxylesterase
MGVVAVAFRPRVFVASPPLEIAGPRARLLRWLRCAGLGILLAIAAILLAARMYYPRLLYPAPQGDAHAPGEGELLTVTARDGVTVHATELVGPKDGTVLVYFHGNGVAMGDVLWMAREFVRRGIGVVLAEYRGYGLSSGAAVPPSEGGLYEDAEAVLAALRAKGVGPERIALFGESLGTGIAVEMAARGRGSALVLVTPYTSIPEVASRFVFGLPAGVVMRERFDSLAKAARVRVPALLLHGTHDGVVPYAMSTKLAKALPQARLITVEAGHHHDLFLGERWRLFDEVVDFVRRPHQ